MHSYALKNIHTERSSGVQADSTAYMGEGVPQHHPKGSLSTPAYIVYTHTLFTERPMHTDSSADMRDITAGTEDLWLYLLPRQYF